MIQNLTSFMFYQKRNVMKRFLLMSLSGMTALCGAAQESYSWDEDLHHRLALDFSKSEKEVVDEIRKYIPTVTESQIRHWEQSGALEMRVVDGERRYFHQAAANLFRIDPDCRAIKAKMTGKSMEGCEKVDQENVPAIMKAVSKGKSHLAEPKHLHLRYTLTVKADAVPAGETVRCWLPYPRTDIDRQKDVKLLNTSEKQYQIAPDTCAHSTLYMEKKAVAGQPTVFSEEFEFTSYGFWANLKPEDVKPYDTSTELYRHYTSERDRHIVFTPRLRQLADSLTRGIDNPLLRARRIFAYIDQHYPWASAREYSTIENIPEYVVENHHGDCGQVTLLFLTLCRLAGIPAHFQSGFMLHPGSENLHDWGEIYFEGVGWVPVDQSFGIPSYAKDEATTYFFVGGIDSWRMIVNQDFGMPLSPRKTFPRSETVDFQRGEVEWRGGNLYFDQWSWNLESLEK